MPTYDYVCSACEHRFEFFQRMSDGALRKCPACGQLRLRRLMGAGAGVIFRGSGFYETDYKRKSSGNGAASGGAGRGAAGGNGAAKDSKATEKKENAEAGRKAD